MPGVKLEKRNAPVEVDVLVREPPVSFDESVTLAPATGAPLASVTVPLTAPAV